MLARLALSACLVLGAGLACNSDDLLLEVASTSTGASSMATLGSTTLDPTTQGPTTQGPTTGDPTPGDPTTGDPPPQQTCRDVLMCVGKCALTLDPACFQACAEDLPPDEAAKAAALGLCVGQGCFGSGTCSPDTLMDPPCLACIAFGVLDLHPDGCEDQADACT